VVTLAGVTLRRYGRRTEAWPASPMPWNPRGPGILDPAPSSRLLKRWWRSSPRSASVPLRPSRLAGGLQSGRRLERRRRHLSRRAGRPRRGSSTGGPAHDHRCGSTSPSGRPARRAV